MQQFREVQNSNQGMGGHDNLSYPDFGGNSHSHDGKGPHSHSENNRNSHDHGHPIGLNNQYPNIHNPNDHTHSTHKSNQYPYVHDSENHSHSQHKHNTYPYVHNQGERNEFKLVNNRDGQGYYHDDVPEGGIMGSNSAMRQNGRMTNASFSNGTGMSNGETIDRRNGSYIMANSNRVPVHQAYQGGSSGGANKVGIISGPDFNGSVNMGGNIRPGQIIGGQTMSLNVNAAQPNRSILGRVRGREGLISRLRNVRN